MAGERWGLSPARMLEILDNSVMSSPLLKMKGPNMVISHDFTTNFPLKHAQKDLRQALQVADSLNIPTGGGESYPMSAWPGNGIGAPWRPALTADWDGDGCSDIDELGKLGTQPKGCGDDPWNPLDSNKTDFSGAYDILIEVLRAEATPGYGGIYFSCLADIQQTGNGKTDGDLDARAYCYTDNFAGVVNAQG